MSSKNASRIICRCFLILSVFAVSASLTAADEQKAIPRDKYIEFKWQPSVVKTEKADSEVRNQFDLTVPMHGQYLINPGSDSMTICWITRVPCAAGIDYREAGTTEFKRIWQKIYGQVDFSKDMHSFHLTGLKPGTEYEYRLLSACDGFFAYDQSAFEGREIFKFRTLDPGKKKFKAFFTADFHGSARLLLDPMLDNSGANDADLFIYLGDNVEDNMNNARYYIFFGFIDDISRIYGKSKPSIFIRGNHDISGRESYEYGTYFPRKDEKTYYSFRQGDVLFIVLDSMWVGTKSKVINQAYDEYRAEQVEWLKKLKTSDEFKKAKFRIVMAHVGTHGQSADFMYEPFKEVLNGNTDDDRIHIMLTGHEHIYMRFDPLTVNSKVSQLPPKYKPVTPEFNYTLVVSDKCDAIVMNAEEDKLAFNVFTSDGRKKDAFTISPEGKVTDNMEVKSFPPPPPPAPKAKK